MDKKSILGLFIIGAILFAFSLWNANQVGSDETTSKTDTTKTSTGIDTPEKSSPLVAKKDSSGNQLIDSLDRWVYTDTTTGRDTFIVVTATTNASLSSGNTSTSQQQIVTHAPEQLKRLENDVLILDIS